ncbi:MAG TPA: hypothetical protein DHW82_00785 [Spirochaetia bacterium]|nr:hypothetical protein [Spirochaetia bacterium]
MAKKVSLSFKLIGGFAGIALLTLFVGLMGWYGIGAISKDLNLLGKESIPNIVNLEVIKVSQLEVRVILRTLMNPYITENVVKTQFENLDKTRKQYQDAMEEYEKTAQTPEEKKLWEDFKLKLSVSAKHNNEYVEEAKKLLDKTVNKEELARKLYKMNMEGEIREAFFNQFQALNKTLAYVKDYYGVKIVDDSIKSGERLNLIILIIAAVSFILAILLGVWIARSISKPVGAITADLFSSSESLQSAANQVSTSSQELSSGAAELASSVEEMTSSLEELSSIIESNTKNINESEILMQSTMTSSMTTIRKMEDMTKAMAEINQSSEQVKRIIKVIDDIAFQTNILALNAAIEAARAGEAGKGFMVVAEQVKNLAQKSAEAAKETEYLIENALKNTEGGERTGKEAAEKLKKLVTMTAKVSKILQEVNSASKEQLRGANQVNEASVQINQVVQTAASSSEELSASGEELFEHSETILSAVEELNVLTEGEK